MDEDDDGFVSAMMMMMTNVRRIPDSAETGKRERESEKESVIEMGLKSVTGSVKLHSGVAVVIIVIIVCCNVILHTFTHTRCLLDLMLDIYTYIALSLSLSRTLVAPFLLLF